jgi:DinB superfamily
MSDRIENLANKVEQANNDLLRAVERVTDERWGAKCADGEWTQGFAGYHAAASIGGITGMLQGLVKGVKLPPMTMADIDEQNASLLKEHEGCTKQEALEMIRTNSPASMQFVRGLSDADLDRKVSLLTDAPEMTIEQVAEMLLVGHPTGHAQSITNAS